MSDSQLKSAPKPIVRRRPIKPPMSSAKPTKHDTEPVSDSEIPKVPSFVRKFTKETMRALDERYDDPERMGGFKVYFGKKHKDHTFEEAAQDADYTRYIMGLDAKTSCMHLFHRYIEATHPELCRMGSEHKAVGRLTPINQ